MSQIIEAVYDGTVLKPVSDMSLEPDTRVRLTYEVIPTPIAKPKSFLATARSLNLQGPADWSETVDAKLNVSDTPE